MDTGAPSVVCSLPAKSIIDFLNASLKEILPLLDAECGSLFLFDSDRKELILNSYINAQQISIENIKRRIGEGISGKVVEHKSPVLVRDIDHDPRFNRNGFNHYHTKSFISIPLSCNSGLIGLVNIADKKTGEPFSEKDLQFAVVLLRYACAIVDNMTRERMLAQDKEMLDKQKALLEKYASVGKLAAGIVHELNNPLDGIIRYTNILLNQMTQMNTNSAAKEYLLEIKKGLCRIVNITKTLLEFSHIANVESSKARGYADLYQLIDDSLELLKGRINGSIRIEKCYQTRVPRILDIGISHVLINIIKNAIDAMPQGGTLELGTVIRDSCVCITFKDTGIGMASDVKKRIFEPFFTTKSIDQGTGLGLAISKEIINKYEGSIEVYTEKGKGTTFTILIPTRHLEYGHHLS